MSEDSTRKFLLVPNSPLSLRTEHSVDLVCEEDYVLGDERGGEEGQERCELPIVQHDDDENPLGSSWLHAEKSPAIRQEIRLSLLSLVDAAEQEEKKLRKENQSLKEKLQDAEEKLASARMALDGGKCYCCNCQKTGWMSGWREWVKSDPVRSLGRAAVVQGFISCSILIWALFQ
jgi:hypothetical protein